MKPGYYILRSDFTVLEEHTFWEGNSPETERMESCFSWLDTLHRSMATSYPNEYHAKKAIERVKKETGETAAMAVIKF